MEKQIQLIKKELKPNDIIIVKFDIEKWDIEECACKYNEIKEKIRHNPVIGLVDGVELQFEDWERLYQYVMSIKPQRGED